MKRKMPPNVGEMSPNEIYEWLEREKERDDVERRYTREQHTIIAVKVLLVLAINALVYLISGFVYTSGPNDTVSTLSPRPVWMLFQVLCNILVFGGMYLEKHDL